MALALLAGWDRPARAAELDAFTLGTWRHFCAMYAWEDAEPCLANLIGNPIRRTPSAGPTRAGTSLRASPAADTARPLDTRVGRVAPAAVGSAGGAVRGDDWGGFRPYIHFRLGQAVYSDPGSSDLITLESPSGEPVLGFSLGANLNRFIGVELAIDNVETDLNAPTPELKSGEYSVWTALVQARLRYPFLESGITPYLLIGAGGAYGEFNDRNVLLTAVLPGSPEVSPVIGGSDSSFAGSIGAGIEYFVAPNIALGIEGRYLYLAETDIRVVGGDRSIDLSSFYYGAASRIYLDDGGPRRLGPAADSDETRAYVTIRAGAAFYTRAEGSNGVTIDGQGTQAGAATAGLNLDEHFGLELAMEYSESEISVAGLGRVAEFSLWTALAQVRYRYALPGGRLVPYAVAGGGIGFSQINDRFLLSSASALTGDTNATTFIASLGAGLDYFIAENLAFTGEVKYVRPFPADVALNNVPVDLDIDPIFLTTGLRVLF